MGRGRPSGRGPSGPHREVRRIPAQTRVVEALRFLLGRGYMESLAFPPRPMRAVASTGASNEPGALPAAALPVPPRLLGAVASGTLLNPLNTSMIAVALVTLHTSFGVSLSTVTWLVSGYYLAGAVGMPLMGRLADLWGPRHVFAAGLAIVGVTGAVAPFVPTFGWLFVVRAVQAFGGAAAYPAGLAMFRARDPVGRAPAEALGLLSVVSYVAVGFGPALGGVLIEAGGWPAIFLGTVPAAALGLTLCYRWVPPDSRRVRAHGPMGRREAVRSLDIPGMLLFSGFLAALLTFLLSLPAQPLWVALGISGAVATGFLWVELRSSVPFLDVRALSKNTRLAMVFVQFATINVAFYGVFFGLPIWLQDGQGLSPAISGLLLLPLAAATSAATYVAARLTRWWGSTLLLTVGSSLMLAALLLLLLLDVLPTVPVMVAGGGILGVAYGFSVLALQVRLYEAAPVRQIGASGGLYQTFRYLGAILSTALVGVTLGVSVGRLRLEGLLGALVAISVLLIALIAWGRRSSPEHRRPAVPESTWGTA